MWMVVGFGNSLRSDDCFGAEVCKALTAHQGIENFAEIVIAHQLTPELVELVSQAAGVIFVDASSDLAPGQLQFIALSETVDGTLDRTLHQTLDQALDGTLAEIPDQTKVNNPRANSPFSHHYTPQTVLTESGKLYGRTPQGWLCTVGGQHFELGEELSPPVKATVTQAVQLILKRIGLCGSNQKARPAERLKSRAQV